MVHSRAPSYQSLTAIAPEDCDDDNGTESRPMDSTTMNRFGALRRKAKSHATLLGFHAHMYVPEEKLKGKVDEEVLQSLQRDKSRMALKSNGSSSNISEGLRDLVEEAMDRGGRSSTFSTLSESEKIYLAVDDLRKNGLSLDEITQFVYEHLHDQELPNFMRYLHLDQDGGLDRIHQLWNMQRVYWAVVLFVFVVMNIIYLLSSNWTVFQAYWLHVWTDATEVRTNVNEAVTDMQHVAAEAAQAGSTANIYASIEDKARRYQILQLAGAVGTCEVLWVLLKVAHAFHQWRIFACDSKEYRSYQHGLKFFQESLPVLSTFSLLKFVSLVHPSMIATDFLDMQQERLMHRSVEQTAGQVLTSVYFFTTRLLLAFLAVVSFATKLLAVCLKLIDPAYRFQVCFVETALLMNQCMGCVLFERVLQDRIFLFIFGGSDTEFREDELALKGVYRCRLAKQIWEHYWTQAEWWNKWKGIVMLATLDHFDLQMLLINDPPANAPHEKPDHQFRRGDGSSVEGSFQLGSSRNPNDESFLDLGQQRSTSRNRK